MSYTRGLMATRTRLTPKQRAARIDSIVEQRARGFRWSSIAGDHGISERQAMRLYDEYEGDGRWTGRDPVALAGEVVEQYDAAIEELARLAATTKHDGTKLGAIKGRVEMIAARTQLLIALGVLPDDLCDLALIADGQEMAKRLMAVIEEFHMDDDVVEAMARAFGATIPQ